MENGDSKRYGWYFSSSAVFRTTKHDPPRMVTDDLGDAGQVMLFPVDVGGYLHECLGFYRNWLQEQGQGLNETVRSKLSVQGVEHLATATLVTMWFLETFQGAGRNIAQFGLGNIRKADVRQFLFYDESAKSSAPSDGIMLQQFTQLARSYLATVATYDNRRGFIRRIPVLLLDLDAVFMQSSLLSKEYAGARTIQSLLLRYARTWYYLRHLTFDNMTFDWFVEHFQWQEVRQSCVLPIARLHLRALQTYTNGCYNDAQFHLYGVSGLQWQDVQAYLSGKYGLPKLGETFVDYGIRRAQEGWRPAVLANIIYLVGAGATIRTKGCGTTSTVS